MDNDDINAMLLARKTSSDDGGLGSLAWIHGNKKAGKRKLGTAADGTSEKDSNESPAKVHKKDGASGLDLAALQKAKEASAARSREENAASIQNPSASLLASTTSGQLVASKVLEYVMQIELGGRKNALHGDDTLPVPPRAALLFESAAMAPAARHSITHIVDGVALSQPHAARVADAVVRYRRGLHVCCFENDLVGSWSTNDWVATTSADAPGLPARSRLHALNIVSLALRGEKPQRDDEVDRKWTEDAQINISEKPVALIRLFDTTAAIDASTDEDALAKLLAGSSDSDDDGKSEEDTLN